MTQSVFFTTEAIVGFLRDHGKGSNTKDYEFVVSVMLKNFCEKQWGERCKIGFEFKADCMVKLPKEGTLELEQVAELFRKNIDEDSPIDCSIAKEKPNKKGVLEGCPFQLKRFGIGRDKVDTDTLIEYINSLKDKYAKTEACLVIVIDGKKETEIEFPKIKDGVDTSTFPFKRLMFAWMTNNKIYFGETYPEYGMEEYDPQEMIK